MAQFGGWIARIALLEPYSAGCGAPYVQLSVFMQVNTRHPLYWTTEMTAVWLFFFASRIMGVDVRTSAHPANAFYNNDCDGRIFIAATAPELQALGFSMGSAQRFAERRERWLSSYSWPPSDTMDPNDPTLRARLIAPEPFDITLTFVLERIIAVDELAGEFEVELMVMLSWEDNKIFARCDSAGVGGFAADDPCGLFWQPTLIWPNIKLDPHPAATLTPAVIEDFGLTTVIGSVAAANEGTAVGAVPSAVTNNSFGLHMYRVRGTFFASFDFHGFPYDWQKLDVTVQLPYTLPMRKARLVARAEARPWLASPGTSIWDVACATARNSFLDYANFTSIMMRGNGPFARWVGALLSLPPAEQFVEMGGGDLHPDNQRWGTATLSIHVARISNFYTWNFVLIIALLVFASFFSVLVPPASLDARLGLTLTVILGLNVFQIVVIDNTPNTGYLTSMHTYAHATPHAAPHAALSARRRTASC